MEEAQKCWYSLEGLKELDRVQKEGEILRETKDGRYVVKFSDTKTPHYFAKRFITTDPLAALWGTQKKKSRNPITISEHEWFYVEKDKIALIEEQENAPTKHTTFKFSDIFLAMSDEKLIEFVEQLKTQALLKDQSQ